MAKGYARSFDQIVCGDFETYYDDDLSLRKMAQAEYIRDMRFHVTAVGLMLPHESHARVYHERDVAKALDEIDWSRTAFLGHHTQFDAMILTYFYGIFPCFYLDTLSMGRALHGTHGRLDLDFLAKLYGRKGKVNKKGLVNMKGVHDMDTLPPDQKQQFIEYTADDVEDTLHIGTKQLLQFPVEELQLIDMTVRMFVEPMIEINAELAQKINDNEIVQKADLLKYAGVTDPKQLSSNAKFAELLTQAGVQVPTKISKKTGEVQPALALGDIAFKDLRLHPDPVVCALVEARIATKSTLMETRSAALVRRAKQDVGNFPVYLKYAGAHTLRWSGGDKVNPQNLTRGSDLRKALTAPEGYMFNICDSAQIEARGNAWRAGQEDIIIAFRNGIDVYRYVAAHSIYSKAIEDITKDERFVGKTCVLGLGYGMGAPKFRNTLRIGQFGPPVDMPLEDCYNIVAAWRASNHHIVSSWKHTERLVKAAFLGGIETTDGLLHFERFKTDGYIHLPNGLYMRYHNVNTDEEGNLIYETRMGKQKLYGGLLVENIIQCLSRIVIGEQMLIAQAELPMRIVTCTHDEIVGLSKIKDAERNQEKLTRIMSTPPEWAKDLPLGADGNIAQVYYKS